MAFPKMTLSVELIGEFKVDINLLHITNMFINNNNEIKTKNRWSYRRSDYFSIEPMKGVVFLPQKPNIDKDIHEINFINDYFRKFLLKDFYESLIDWSSNHFFKTNKIYHPNPHIEFNDKLWIIY
jgi:hypothetical protein